MKVKTPGERISASLENPVLDREFRARMRGARSYLTVGGYALTVSIIVLIVYWVATHDSSTRLLNERAAEIGRNLWIGGIVTQIFLLPMIVPAFTCGAITLEREREMLELLLLTHQSAYQICLGKLLAGVRLGFMLVLASVPVLSLSFLLGGVSPGEMLACLLLLLASVLLSGALGLATSAFAPKTFTATVISYLLVGFALLGVPVLAMFLQSAMRYDQTDEFRIVVMLLVTFAMGFPPGLMIALVLAAIRALRGLPTPVRKWWLLTIGLSWSAVMLLLFLPGATPLLQQSEALWVLHPFAAFAQLMMGGGPMTGWVAQHQVTLCIVSYLGASLVLFTAAERRVWHMRVG